MDGLQILSEVWMMAQLQVALLLVVGLAVGVGARCSSASLRRGIWCLTLLGALLVPIITRVGPTVEVSTPWARLLGRSGAQPAGVSRMGTGASEASLRGAEPDRDPQAAIPALTAAVAASPDPRIDVGPVEPVTDIEDTLNLSAVVGLAWPGVLLGLWSIGVAVLLARFALGALACEWLRRSSGVAEPRIVGIAASACRSVGVKHGEVRVSSRVRSPMVVGIVAPSILLPRAAQRWTDERLAGVLLHEFSHIAAGDTRWRGLVELARALYWPNPLIWMVRAAYLRDAEFAADDAVLRAGLRPSAYAGDLLQLTAELRGLRTAGLPRVAGTAMLGRGGIRGRVERLLTSRFPRTALTRHALAPMVLAFVGLVLCIAVPRLVDVSGSVPVWDSSNEDTASSQICDVPPWWPMAVQLPAARLDGIPVSSAGLSVWITGDALVLRWSGGDGRGQTYRFALDQGRLRGEDVSRHEIARIRGFVAASTLRAGAHTALLFADRDARGDTLVDVLYSLGQAGIAHYRFAYAGPRGVESIEVVPPRFRAGGTAEDPPATPWARVSWLGDGVTVALHRPSASAALGFGPELKKIVGIDDETAADGLTSLVTEACRVADGPVQVWLSPGANTTYGQMMEAAGRARTSCTVRIGVLAGGGD